MTYKVLRGSRLWIVLSDMPDMNWHPSRFERVHATVPAAADMVRWPQHYARFTIEPITFINANKLPYNIGNVVKYACRFDAKNGVEDLRKAIRYLEIQIETMGRESRIEAGEDKRDVWKMML